MIHVDTHVVIWLYAAALERFPKAVQEVLEMEDLGTSPAVLLELQYLREIGRITVEGPLILETLAASIGLELLDIPFRAITMEALCESWTRDPFDRFIVAHAKAEKARLLTKDKAIRKHYPEAFWA